MQTPYSYTHIPQAPDVPSTPAHADQRYFKGLTNRREVYASGKHIAALRGTEVDVYRHGPDDSAQLTIQVEHPAGKSVCTAYLKPAELRDLAQRLLDAAHDIEANPAAKLRAAQAEQVAA